MPVNRLLLGPATGISAVVIAGGGGEAAGGRSSSSVGKGKATAPSAGGKFTKRLSGLLDEMAKASS